jgi:ABC-type multidrug transport system ATPase subunit
MPEGQVLEFSRLSKQFGSVQAVSDLTARVEPGAVTGFLGPNGAGKTTTLRMLLGLVRPSSGTATIGGAPYARLKKPLQTVGAVLEASSFHPGRTGANHLKIYAQAAGLSRSRIDETLGLVGLADAAGRKVGGYSLGMRQRLGLAYALLGDPGVLVLDEPANGLDPEGIKWLRGFLQQLAREGRTVLVSSHLLTEVQQTADAVLILADGRRVFNGAIADLVDPAEQVTIVDSGDRAGLVAALRDAGIASEVLRSGVTVRSAAPAEVGRAAAAAGIPLTALQRRGPALEEVFLDLVSGVRVHPSADAGHMGAAAAAAAAAGAAVSTASEPAAAEPVEPEPAEPEGTEAERTETAGAELAGAATAADEPVITGKVVVAPAIAAAAETPDEETEFDAPPPGEEMDATGPVPEAEPEPGPSFAVAGTGVIDIVSTPLPPLDEDDDEEEFEDDDEVPEDIESAYVTHSAHADEDERTESDLAADAFFAAFDHGDAPEQPADDAGGNAGPPDDSPADDSPADDSEKGVDLSQDEADDSENGVEESENTADDSENGVEETQDAAEPEEPEDGDDSHDDARRDEERAER